MCLVIEKKNSVYIRNPNGLQFKIIKVSNLDSYYICGTHYIGGLIRQPNVEYVDVISSSLIPIEETSGP